MSLLLKALQRADRGSDLSLQPMDARRTETAANASGAQSTADLMFAKQAAAEQKRMLFLIGALVLTVVGMGGYFYIAVYMPWLLLPKPPAPALRAPAPPAAVSAAPAPPVMPVSPAAAPAVGEKLAVTAPDPAPVMAKPAGRVPAARPATSGNDSGVQFTAGGSGVASNDINRAYQLLQDGRLNEARGLYEKLRATEPRSADVVLGLAVIAQRQDKPEQAAQLYLKALEIDPKNSFAQASLTTMIARADPAASEAKFKQLLAQQPAAYLHFALGNLYAAQGRWPEAQTAYFDAQRQAPESPDYAFNLAISLEHIGQPKAALDYYQRALRLAQTHGAAFDANQARARIQQISSGKN
jgi:tetratricopeptide (TPR) repeat protein